MTTEETPFQFSDDSAFGRAWSLFVEGADGRDANFVESILSSQEIADPEAITNLMIKLEAKHSARTPSRIIANLKPVLGVLETFGSIADTLASLIPGPGAIIWGAIKIILKGLSRYNNLFDTIAKELCSLSGEILRVNQWKQLYAKDEIMQDLFCHVYIHMIRFWALVHSECGRSSLVSRMKRAAHAFAFDTPALDEIISAMRTSIDAVANQAFISEAKLSRAEHSAADKERKENHLFRESVKKENTAAREYREEQRAHQAQSEFEAIARWLTLGATQSPGASSYARHDAQKRCISGTCKWLAEHPSYLGWLNGESEWPILWVHAPPGTGKSHVSSAVIDSLAANETISTAYFFYDFRQPYTAIDTLRCLAEQLLSNYRSRSNHVSEELKSVTQEIAHSQSSVQKILILLARALPRTAIVIDGLDEGLADESWNTSSVKVVTEFIIELVTKHTPTARLWCSSQYRPYIQSTLGRYPQLDISLLTKGDIRSFLRATVETLPGLSPEEQQSFLTNLESRAGSNFLWASLMIQYLNECAVSSAHMKEIIHNKHELPSSLDEYYRSILGRILQGHRKLACFAFSMVAFAKRPLRLEELMEATGILLSHEPSKFSISDIPFENLLLNLLAPLVEVKEECTDGYTDKICYIFHSTVKDFFVANPGVLSTSTDLRVSSCVPARACLAYLAQDRYIRTLELGTSAKWCDGGGKAVEDHQFLLYSAKYWDKHLDTLPDMQTCENLRDQVISFIKSSNFKTCIQVQSLWVHAQFSTFSIPIPLQRSYLRRVFPHWLVESDEGRRLWEDYRRFLHEWRYFLNCDNCNHHTGRGCKVLPSVGDLSQCWWSALGPSNFLSCLNDRRGSFSFCAQVEFSNMQQVYQSLPDSRYELVRLYLSIVPSSKVPRIYSEFWKLDTEGCPELRRRCEVDCAPSASDWATYSEIPDSKKLRQEIAPFVLLSHDHQTLRVGTRIYSRNQDDGFSPIDDVEVCGTIKHPAYIEEFARRDHIVVLTSRLKLINCRSNNGGCLDEDESGSDDSDESDSYPEDDCESWSESSSRASDCGDDGYSSEPEDSSESSAEESSNDGTVSSGSSGSTDDSDLQDFSELFIKMRKIRVRQEQFDKTDEEDSDDDKSKEDGEHGEHLDDNSSSSSSSDSEVSIEAIIGPGQQDEDEADFDLGGPGTIPNLSRSKHHSKFCAFFHDEDGGSDGDERKVYSHTWRTRFRRSKWHYTWATISILGTSPEGTKTLFTLSRPLLFGIYDSPPIIHPSHPLVVWPLGCGDILFVDFERGSHFMRQIRPSTYRCRQVSIKCRFSKCGRYLHIVSLEARQGQLSASSMGFIKLAVVVMTYRLSLSKPSRVPPSLLHRVRVAVGDRLSIDPSKLPFTLTWKDKEVYIIYSGKILQMYRVQLFKDSAPGDKVENSKAPHDQQQDLFKRPKASIFLPESADKGLVYYVPPRSPEYAGKIVVSGGTQLERAKRSTIDQLGVQVDKAIFEGPAINFDMGAELKPPVGCFIRETDFGGWTAIVEDEDKIEQNRDAGFLRRRVEKFDPNDDCDLEPYIY